MSVKRIKLLERVFEAFNLDGHPPAGSMTADVEWHPVPHDPEFEVRQGRAAVYSYLGDWSDAFQDVRADLLDIIPSGDHILVWLKLSGKIRDSETRVELEQAIVYTFREDRISMGREFTDRGEAEKVAGIR